MSYSIKLEQQKKRQSDNNLLENILKGFSNNTDSKPSTEQEKAIQYLNNSMAKLSERSTEISYEEGERVKKHLEEKLKEYDIPVEFRYQGSVVCGTNIKYYSDIDLLVINNKFETVENGSRVNFPYNGNPTDDMKKLRKACIDILNNSYEVASIKPGNKAITLSGGSLRRNIDVVPSNWFLSENYYKTGRDYYKGVQVFNNETNERSVNYPFLIKELIDQKDKNCNGLYRPLVRLAKNLKEDSELNIDISSYDMQAIFYNMDDFYFNICGNDRFRLVEKAMDYLGYLLGNRTYFSSLYVPDETRKISDKVSYNSLQNLYSEFISLTLAIEGV